MKFIERRLAGRLLAGMVVVMLARTPALGKQVECPSTVAIQESADLAQLEGWRTYDTSIKGSHNFFDVGFSEGPPEKLVFRTPSKSTVTKKSKLEVYDLSSGVSGELWISCIYRDTALSLTRRLPEKFSRCEVAYDPSTGLRSVKRIDCF
jgi:hypothetical protein